MKVLGIIPARWASSRYPGKPLVNIGGKSMIQRVYEQSCKAIERVVVATDDQRIVDEVKRFNGHVVMTKTDHQSGTDRCMEALDVFEKESGEDIDIVVNIQGDEPFIQPKQIEDIINCFKDPKAEISTLIKKVTEQEALFNPNNPKVVLTSNSEAIYFSRSTIPYIVGEEKENWLKVHNFYEHLGLYGYKSVTLRKLTKLKPSFLENAESLEQNRWLENGFRIKVAETDHENISIDTVEDLELILSRPDFDDLCK